MRTATIFIVMAALVIATSVACRPAASPVSIANQPVSINDAPRGNTSPRLTLNEMTWTTSDKKTQSISSFAGKALVLDFWATDCPPCREEVPHLTELQSKYGPDLQIIGLHVGDDEDRARVPAFVEQYKINFPIGYPGADLDSFIFGETDVIPQTAIFDRSGRMVQKFVGFDPATPNEMEQVVQAALASN